MTNWKKVVIQLFFYCCIFGAFWLFAREEKKNSPNANDAKLHQMASLALETPLYPTFREVAAKTVSRSNVASFDKCYVSTSSVAFQEVKRFYTDSLITQGWNLKKESIQRRWWIEEVGEIIVFQKQNIEIAIEYVNQSQKYCISHTWWR